jgi:hypothetical protein
MSGSIEAALIVGGLAMASIAWLSIRRAKAIAPPDRHKLLRWLGNQIFWLGIALALVGLFNVLVIPN